ncbi:MAG: SUMF1/EgtB/PvdO family nonheme iron enzyme [Phycisphaerales bacterium]
MFFFNKSCLKSLIIISFFTTPCLCEGLLGDNPHFLLFSGDKNLWLEQAINYRNEIISKNEIREPREELLWMSSNFSCRMCMMFDSEFIKSGTDEYLIDSLLAEGEKEFGGYDSIVLWHAYPRLGIDERNQFDMYRQMPGGLEGLSKVVEKCHDKNVRVFIDYNPWDVGTRRERVNDFQALAEIIYEIKADGVFLDTLSAADKNLRKELDSVWPGIALVSEGYLDYPQLNLCSGSWAQWLDEPKEPGILKLKWVQPTHMQYQIRRWDIDRSSEIETAFFNASGMLIWENVFATYNPWNITDRQNWKRANLILHYFNYEFMQDFEPYYPSAQKDLYITHWSSNGRDIFILINKGKALKNAHLFDIERKPELLYFDVWNGKEFKPENDADTVQISGPIDTIGCIAIIHKIGLDDELYTLLDKMKFSNTKVESRNFCKPTAYADKVKGTKIVNKSKRPEGMVFVEGGEFSAMQIEHVRGECGCYPDNDKKFEGFNYGLPFGAVYDDIIHKKIQHRIGPVKIKPFFIDETEITNAQYKKFLDSTCYKPKYTENFLLHWPNGKMPEEIADFPVVNINIDDARAYANWAGKRLPTEEEWQLAAQGLDGRKWPWGNDFDSTKCNTSGQLMPAKSYPNGRSVYGCYNMSGNVWEWTESCRDDGHTRFTMIRGGSYFNAQGSIWYVNGGPQPVNHHTKFVQIWPGIDRCNTVGFRCVVDAK